MTTILPMTHQGEPGCHPDCRGSSDTAQEHIHELAPLTSFKIEPTKAAENPEWGAWLDLGEARVRSAGYLHRLSEASKSEADRLDALNNERRRPSFTVSDSTGTRHWEGPVTAPPLARGVLDLATMPPFAVEPLTASIRTGFVTLSNVNVHAHLLPAQARELARWLTESADAVERRTESECL